MSSATEFFGKKNCCCHSNSYVNANLFLFDNLDINVNAIDWNKIRKKPKTKRQFRQNAFFRVKLL